MTAITKSIKWILLLGGVLTASMLWAALDPQTALTAMFGSAPDSAAATMIARNWAALIGLVGVMMIYAAFNPPQRRFVIVIAGISKAIFIGLALTHLGPALQDRPGLVAALAGDAILVLVFMLYLLSPGAEAVAE